MQVGIKKVHPLAVTPRYAHGSLEDAGVDLVAVEMVDLQLGKPLAVDTGIQLEIPVGYEAQVRTRSGKALEGIVVANSPGTIDSGYRGNIKVILLNVGTFTKTVRIGDKIAQLVFNKIEQVDFIGEESLTEAQCGENGFASTDRQDS